MSRAGTLEALSAEMAKVFEPLAAFEGEEDGEALLWWLGLRVPDSMSGATALVDGLQATLTPVAELAPLIEELVSAIEAEDAAAASTASVALIEKTVAIVDGIQAVADAIDTLSGSLAGLTPDQRTELESFAGQFAERLLSQLLAEYVEARFPHVAIAMLGFGALEIEEVGAGADGELQAPFTRKAFHFDRLVQMLTDPAGLLEDVYDWGKDDFDGLALFTTVKTIIEKQFEIPVEIIEAPGMSRVLEALGFSAEVNDSLEPPGLDLSLRFPGDIALNETVEADDWEITFTAGVSFEADLGVTVAPVLEADFDVPSGSADVTVGMDFGRSESADPFILFGKAEGSRMEVQSIGGGLSLEGHWTSSTGRIAVEPEIRTHLRGAKLVITGEGGDSFIDQVLSAIDIESTFDVALTWSPSGGVQFEGAAGIEIDIAIHTNLGPLVVDTLHLGAGFEDEALKLDLGATVGAELGPVVARVERMGARGHIRFPADGGNLGPAQLDIDFLPPRGVGLSIDTESVKLGGFLSIDTENERYAGAVELRIVDVFDLTAIGLITTRFPDGSKGFSMLFIISTVFPSPIHIAYNFFLSGVGGLLGLHRSVDIDRLRNGLREGAVDDILFPTDVVENMDDLVTDLREIFPPARDQFLVGPMAQITWNTPPLITAELGLIIEFANPLRLAILGVLRAAVPTEDEAIVDIKVNFLGSIDFEKGMLSFDASIYDSYIGYGDFKFSFEGDIALRISWGEKKDFLTSVGGFHPQYSPPAHLNVPSMRRLSLSLLKDNPRLTLSTYFALTTNTVQFGAELEFYFGVSGFSVEGYFGFDVLFQFDPFKFIASVRAGLAVKAGGSTLFSIDLAFELQGTTPWKAKGTASFRVLFVKVKVRFEKTWGERRDLTSPTVEALPEVLTELERETNWRSELSAGASPLVQLRSEARSAEKLLMDPAGRLTVTQTLLPMDVEFSQLGNKKIDDIKRMDVHDLRIGGTSLDLDGVDDEFAPSAFQAMKDRDKLAASAYEQHKAGVAARGGDTLSTDHIIARQVRYEEIVSDRADGAEEPTVVRQSVADRGQLFGSLVPGGAVGRSALSKKKARQAEKGSVLEAAVREERFAVVDATHLHAVDATSVSLSRSQAEERMRQLVEEGADPEEIDLVPEFQLAS